MVFYLLIKDWGPFNMHQKSMHNKDIVLIKMLIH